MFLEEHQRGGGNFPPVRYYRLLFKRPRRCGLKEYSRCFNKRNIAQTKPAPHVIVSTVFLPVAADFLYGRGRALFETMIFLNSESVGWGWGAHTWGEAMRAHRRALKLARRYARMSRKKGAGSPRVKPVRLK